MFCFVFLFVFVNLIAVSSVQAGELYRWVDKDGGVHVTDTPPDPSVCEDDVKSVRAPETTVSQKPQIAVYGRDACSITRRMMSVLDRAGVSYTYEIIDNKAVAAALEKRMRASGIETKSYNLPVVDVDGRIFLRPDPVEVVNMYKYSR
jgi:glutaredoxin